MWRVQQAAVHADRNHKEQFQCSEFGNREWCWVECDCQQIGVLGMCIARIRRVLQSVWNRHQKRPDELRLNCKIQKWIANQLWKGHQWIQTANRTFEKQFRDRTQICHQHGQPTQSRWFRFDQWRSTT